MMVRDPKNGAIQAFINCFEPKRPEIRKIEDLRSSFRSYVARIYYSIDQAKVQSIILKRSFAVNLGFEAQLLRLFSDIQIPVPKVLGYCPDDGVLLLEDLGSVHLENMSNPHEKIDEVLDILCRIHASGILSARRVKQVFSNFKPIRQFDVSGYNRRLTQINLSRLLSLFPNTDFPNTAKNRIARLLLELFDRIAKSYPTAFNPNGITHLILTDLKAHHFFWHQNGFKIIDLESCSYRDVPQIDLVFLLEDNALQLTETQKDKFLHDYINKMRGLIPASNFDFDWETFKLIYEYYRFMFKLFLASIHSNKENAFLQDFAHIYPLNQIMQILHSYKAKEKSVLVSDYLIQDEGICSH